MTRHDTLAFRCPGSRAANEFRTTWKQWFQEHARNLLFLLKVLLKLLVSAILLLALILIISGTFTPWNVSLLCPLTCCGSCLRPAQIYGECIAERILDSVKWLDCSSRTTEFTQSRTSIQHHVKTGVEVLLAMSSAYFNPSCHSFTQSVQFFFNRSLFGNHGTLMGAINGKPTNAGWEFFAFSSHFGL
jgi:hypothetical protein